MTDNKFTDTDIAKALKCCANKKRCHDCPFCVTSIQPCYITLAREAASLLSRRDAEIERLKKELIEQQLKNNLLYETAKEARTEAIKEFAERLKKNAQKFTEYDEGGWGCTVYAVKVEDIDNTVEEMTEGK